jgi:hypothetical protein
MVSTLEIFDPRAPLPRGEGLLPMALDGLAGKVVGFIDNTKPNFNHLVDDLAEVLIRKYGVRAVLKRGKRLQSIPAPEAVIDELAAACDLVIAGSGD